MAEQPPIVSIKLAASLEDQNSDRKEMVKRGYTLIGSKDGVDTYGLHKVTAKFKVGNGEEQQAPVLNPGDWFGKAWLLEVACGYWPVYFVVEADSATDAMDELAESEEYGHHVRIDEDAYADYGSEFSKGDRVGDVVLDKDSWVDLAGKVYDERPGCAGDYTVSGEGVYYDTDNLMVHGDDRRGYTGLLYYGWWQGWALPEFGIKPTELSIWDEMQAFAWSPFEGGFEAFVWDFDRRCDNPFGRLNFNAVRLFAKGGEVTVQAWDDKDEVPLPDEEVPDRLRQVALAFAGPVPS